MNTNLLKEKIPWKLIGVVFGFILAIMWISSIISTQQKESLIHEQGDYLKYIAESKVRKIQNWKKDLIRDGEANFNNPFISSYLKNILKNGKRKLDKIIFDWIRYQKSIYKEYLDVFLFDSAPTLLGSVIEGDSTLNNNYFETLLSVKQKKSKYLGDLQRSKIAGLAYFDLVIPVLDADSLLIGIFLVRINPNFDFFEMVQSWPVLTTSGEVLIVKAEKDSILYLNDLRFRENKNLSFRMPISDTNLPASKAARGIEGLVKGIDYRGKEVLSVVKNIPGTPWAIVTKIDKEEIDNLTENSLLTITIIEILLIVFTGVGIGLFWKREKVKYYENIFHSELEKNKIERKYKNLVENLNEGIWLIDENSTTTFVNTRMAQMLGYTIEEMLGKHLFEFMDEDGIEKSKKNLEKRKQGIREQHAFEFISKSGSKVITLVEAAPLLDENDEYQGAIAGIMDISLQKKAEEALKQSEERYRKLLNSITDYIYTAQIIAGKIVSIVQSPGCITITGYTKDDFDAAPELWEQIVYHDDKIIFKEHSEKLLNGFIDAYIEYRIIHKSGQLKWIRNTPVPRYDSNNKYIGYDGLVQDITERKIAEEALYHEMAFTRALLENVNDAIVACDAEGKLTIFNRSAREWHGGLDVLNIPQEKWVDFYHVYSFDGKKIMESDQVPLIRAFRGENVINAGMTIAIDNMPARYTLASGCSIYDENKQKIGAVIVMRDITHSRLAEEALRKSEEKFRKLSALAPVGVYLTDAQGKCEYVNEKWLEMSGMKAEDALGNGWINGIFPNDKEIVFKAWNEMTQNKKNWVCEYRFIKPNSEITWVSGVATALFDSNNDVIGYVGANADITKLKHAQIRLQQRENELLKIQKLSKIAGYTWNYESSKIQWTSEFFSIIEREPDSFEHTLASFLSFIHPEDLEVFYNNFNKAIKFNKSPIYEYRFIIPNGKIKHISSQIEIFYSSKKDKPDSIIGYIQDITEAKEEKEEKIMLVSVIEQAVETVIVLNINADIQFVNNAFIKSYGFPKEDIIGKNIFTLESGLFTTDSINRIDEVLQSRSAWMGNLNSINIKGKQRIESSIISPIYDTSQKISNFVIISKDITHEEDLEKRLRQSQKMEAIGTLAGGIAHDFNNILTAILGNTEILMEEIEKNSIQMKYLEKIYSASKRATSLAKQILMFSRQREIEYEPIQINTIVKEAIKLLRASLPSNIEIEQNINPIISIVLADPTQIHQVVMNLATNSKYAMNEKGGKLRIELDDFIISSKEKPLNIEPGKYVRLLISDTGCGIEKSIIDKIFDPYFTTKSTGEGTGLGLAVVHGIIKKHRGEIFVESVVNEGTKFTILFPAVEMQPKIEEKIREEIFHGTGSILFVDDEESIVEINGEILSRTGYRVTLFTNSMEALEIFKKNPADFDLIITDMTMPKMLGSELAKAAKEIREDIPVIICTGYSEILKDINIKTSKIDKILIKPIIRSKLLTIVKEVLENKNKASSFSE